MAEYMIIGRIISLKFIVLPVLNHLLSPASKIPEHYISDLNKQLAEKGMLISNGYGELKDKTFRIGHMGDLMPEDMEELTSEMEKNFKTILI